MNFEQRVNEAIREMIKLGYKPQAFITMTITEGTVNATRRLIKNEKISDGFTKLWQLGRLDLSVENIIQENE